MCAQVASNKRSPATPAVVPSAADVAYLARVREAAPPLSEREPIWLRHGVVRSGPAIPFPERHPCCEFGVMLSGRGIEFAGSEHAVRRPGDVFLAGPGVPHWMEIQRYPVGFVTVYFLPRLLIELGPESDGLRLLRRFTAASTIAQRLLRPPQKLRERLTSRFREMSAEFDARRFGREVRLRTLLLEGLVDLMRWEQEARVAPAGASDAIEWSRLHAALDYLHGHYSEAVYARDVAAAAELSETQLKLLFRAALGMPWGRYLQSYRVHRAAAMLSSSGCSVLEAALASGFDTLSHFNATFRAFLGVAPGAYRRTSAPFPSGGSGVKPQRSSRT